MVGGQYVPDFLFQDDFCPLWPPGQAQCHLAGLLRGWHADASGGPLTAVLKALLDRLACCAAQSSGYCHCLYVS